MHLKFISLIHTTHSWNYKLQYNVLYLYTFKGLKKKEGLISQQQMS